MTEELPSPEVIDPAIADPTGAAAEPVVREISADMVDPAGASR